MIRMVWLVRDLVCSGRLSIGLLRVFVVVRHVGRVGVLDLRVFLRGLCSDVVLCFLVGFGTVWYSIWCPCDFVCVIVVV